MDRKLMWDPDIYPTNDVLKKELGIVYPAFENLMAKVSSPEFNLTTEWRYYNDGKAWLCKVCKKKKTVFWLSVWDTFFRTTFYFTEKTGSGIPDLDIDKKWKKVFSTNKPVGRLIPLTVIIKDEAQVLDVLKIAEYKMSLK